MPLLSLLVVSFLCFLILCFVYCSSRFHVVLVIVLMLARLASFVVVSLRRLVRRFIVVYVVRRAPRFVVVLLLFS